MFYDNGMQWRNLNRLTSLWLCIATAQDFPTTTTMTGVMLFNRSALFRGIQLLLVTFMTGLTSPTLLAWLFGLWLKPCAPSCEGGCDEFFEFRFNCSSRCCCRSSKAAIRSSNFPTNRLTLSGVLSQSASEISARKLGGWFSIGFRLSEFPWIP